MNKQEFIEKVAHVAVTKIKEGMGWTEDVGYHVNGIHFEDTMTIGGYIVTSDTRHQFSVELGVERNFHEIREQHFPHVVVIEIEGVECKFSLEFDSRFNRFIWNYQRNLEEMKKSIAGNVFDQALQGEYKGVKILKTPELVKSELVSACLNY